MSLEFTLVRRAIRLAVIDGPDTGDNPDILQAQGSVLFEPVIKKGDSIQVQTRGGSETYALAPIECPINDGIISHRGQDGVKLPAGGEAANPSLIRWKATFSRMQAGGRSFSLAPVIFDAVPGGEIDLTMVAPVAGAPEGVVRGPRGTSLESIIVDGSELVFTAVDDAGSFEIARIPLDEMVRAEAEAAADGVRDALAVDVAASQSARDVAEGHANRAATSESNAKTSETNAKQSETNAGDYAAVATTAATEAVDAMERATDLAGGDFATHEYVDALEPRIDAKADASTVNDLAAVTTGFTGAARRNSRRIRELVSELGDKADKTSVTSALARKADQADVADLSALATSALGVGKRNATQVRQLAAALAGKADQSALTSGLSTKADKADLSTLTTNILDALEAQDADIQTAITTADTASTTAQNVEARVAAVEAVADLAPESPVDGQTASLISQPDSLTKAAVTAAVGAAFKETPPGSGLYTLTI